MANGVPRCSSVPHAVSKLFVRPFVCRARVSWFAKAALRVRATGLQRAISAGCQHAPPCTYCTCVCVDIHACVRVSFACQRARVTVSYHTRRPPGTLDSATTFRRKARATATQTPRSTTTTPAPLGQALGVQTPTATMARPPNTRLHRRGTVAKPTMPRCGSHTSRRSTNTTIGSCNRDSKS